LYFEKAIFGGKMISCFHATLELLSFIADSLNLIINSLLAIAAICASIFAGLTWRQAKKSHVEERESRRSFIAPKDDPGFIKLLCDELNNLRFSICLINFGINPTTRLLCKINFFDISYTPKFWFQTNASNPIPYKGEFNIMISNEHFQKYNIHEPDFTIVNYISVEVSYYDVFLNKFYHDIFCWQVKDDILNETNFEERMILIELTKKINSKETETKDEATKNLD